MKTPSEFKLSVVGRDINERRFHSHREGRDAGLKRIRRNPKYMLTEAEFDMRL